MSEETLKEIISLVEEEYDLGNPRMHGVKEPIFVTRFGGLIQKYGKQVLEEGKKQGYDNALINLGHMTLE